MTEIADKIRQFQVAIEAQEALRPALGDAIVEVTIAVLRSQIEVLQLQAREATPPTRTDGLLEHTKDHPPRELGEKARALGRIEGERKQVTVLFADISGFTTLSERLDAEEVAAITDAVLREMAAAVYEFEGYIDKFIGDAVMAVFGAPVTHEDDPDRALRVALSMRERLKDFNHRWVERVGTPLTMHIGINTGLVIAGNVGPDQRLAYTVMGDTVNTASRLEGAARPGQILVSRNTYRLTQESFAFVDLDPIQVKGKSDPLVVYELHHARLMPSKSRGLKNFKPVFVEREREREALDGLGGRLMAGIGHILAVSGDGGIGKSRLIAEWRASLPPALRWLEGRSFSHTTSLPYGPFLDLFLRYACLGDDDSEELVRQRIRAIVERSFPDDLEAQALLASMLGVRTTAQEDSVLAALPAERRREGLFSFIRQWLVDLASEQPVILILEDMHWADTTSIELVEHLLPLVQSHALMIVGVFRDVHDGLPRIFQSGVAGQYAEHLTHLPLAAISEQGSIRMVQELLRAETVPEQIQHIILQKAEGNPLFIEEVVRMLVERGALVRSPTGEYSAATDLIDQISIPDTLQGVLMARLDRLYPETKWVAQQAAVIGRFFRYQVLFQMTPSDNIDVDIRILEREALISERAGQPEIEYIFKHALTQEVVYQSLLAPRRKELHRRVGTVMEALFADRLAEFFAIIGRHFFLGEEWLKAAQFLDKAGAAAARLYSYAEARIHYADALKALENLPSDERSERVVIDLTLALTRVSVVADEPSANLARLARVKERTCRLLERDGVLAEDRLRMARIDLMQGTFLALSGDAFPAVIACFERVLPVAQEFQDEELLVIPSATIGQAMVTSGLFGAAIPLFSRVLEPLARSRDVTQWILTCAFLGLAETAVGNWKEGQRIVHDALARAVDAGNNTGQIYGHMFLAVMAVHRGDWRRSLLESQKTVRLAEASGDRMYCYFSHGWQALAHSRLGDHPAAFESLARQRHLAASLGGSLVVADWFAAFGAEIALNAGQIDSALELSRAAIDHAIGIGGVFGEGLARRVCAQALFAVGDRQQAEIDEQFALSIERFEAGGAVLEVARTFALWSHADPDRAQAHWSRALEMCERLDAMMVLGSPPTKAS